MPWTLTWACLCLLLCILWGYTSRLALNSYLLCVTLVVPLAEVFLLSGSWLFAVPSTNSKHELVCQYHFPYMHVCSFIPPGLTSCYFSVIDKVRFCNTETTCLAIRYPLQGFVLWQLSWILFMNRIRFPNLGLHFLWNLLFWGINFSSIFLICNLFTWDACLVMS